VESTSADLTSTRVSKSIIKAEHLPLSLCVLFFLSGSSGLIYEVVWLRMLSRTLGSTVYATSTILAVFMGGLALGSFVFGRFADRVRRLLLLYAIIEAGIGLSALASLGMNSWPIPLYRAMYTFAGNSRAALTLGQVLLAAAALLLPTTLMGATLPALCAYGVRRSASVARVAGTLYGLNTIGAMTGVLAAGFVLIGAIGETRTLMVGAAINGLVAVLALALVPAGTASQAAEVEPITAAIDNSASRRIRRALLICFALSGFVSLALEIVWSRMLALYVGTSIYAFSSMLVVMLAGIGLGGWIGSRVERWKDPLLALAKLEMGVALAAALGQAAFAHMEGAYIFVPPLIVVGPTALLLGIAFPVTVRCYTDHARSLGRRVGELYACNTMGCILGSLAGGFFLVPMLGTAHVGVMMVGLAAIASMIVLAAHPRGFRRAGLLYFSLFSFTIAAAACVGDPYFDLAYSRIHNPTVQVFAQAEEAPATTFATGISGLPTQRQLYVNGVGMTVLILADSPRDALVICMGMGTTFRSASRHPNIDVTVVELIPAVPGFMRFFHPDADRVTAQPNAHVVVDDGRNYLLMHQRQFDTIAIDPAPPLYSAGTVNLYTREFFQLCNDRLRPTGAMCVWVAPGQLSEVKTVIHTYATVFPYVTAWSGPSYPGFLLIGTHRPLTGVEARVRKGFDDPVTVTDLTEWDNSCSTPAQVLALRLCDRDALLQFTSDAPMLTDDHPYTEFPLWRINWHDPKDFTTLDAPYLTRWLSRH
jgi:spermidine synthase